MKEKSDFGKNLKEKDEQIDILTQTETELKTKLDAYIQSEKDSGLKNEQYLKQIDDLKNELKLLNEKYEQNSRELK